METIKDLLNRLLTLCRLEVAIVKELEEQGSRIKILEDNRKLKDSAIKQLQQEVAQLKLLARRKVDSDVGIDSI